MCLDLSSLGLVRNSVPGSILSEFTIEMVTHVMWHWFAQPIRVYTLPCLTHRHGKPTWGMKIRPELRVADGICGLWRQAVLLELFRDNVRNNTVYTVYLKTNAWRWEHDKTLSGVSRCLFTSRTLIHGTPELLSASKAFILSLMESCTRRDDIYVSLNEICFSYLNVVVEKAETKLLFFFNEVRTIVLKLSNLGSNPDSAKNCHLGVLQAGWLIHQRAWRPSLNIPRCNLRIAGELSPAPWTNSKFLL